MTANISDNLANWSTTDASNQPDGTDTADIDAEFRRLQAVVRKYMRNKGADIASASTVDLSAATGDYVDITGTTSITGLGTVSAGMRFILQFDDALTLTHSANLVLPGAANITTAAGDHAVFESLGGGAWRCISFMRAAGPVNAAAAGVNTDITSLASPAVGAATATTQSAGDNSTKVATTAYADAAAAAVAYTPPSGSIVQVAYAKIGSVVTGTNTIPMDDSIPQQSEGVEVVTVSITPTDVLNTLVVEGVVQAAHDSNSDITAALFQDATADALAAAHHYIGGGSKVGGIQVAFDMVAGTTSSTTFKLRAGANGSGNLTINGAASGRYYGGVGYSWIKVTELKT